jgi:MFS family permease
MIMGSFVPISALLFCFTLSVTQAWLTDRRCHRANYIWVGASLLGLVTATLGAIASLYLSIFLFQLDVLQNSQQGAIAITLTAVTFGVLMALFQWLILRRKVRNPFLQAALNVILGTLTWLFLVSRILDYANAALGLPLFILFSVLLGIGIGSVSHITLNWIF